MAKGRKGSRLTPPPGFAEIPASDERGTRRSAGGFWRCWIGREEKRARPWALFLFPDNLSTWMFSFAVLIAASVWVSMVIFGTSYSCALCTAQCTTTAGDLWIVVAPWFAVVFPLLWFLTWHFIVYYWSRQPVLKQIWEHWPVPLSDWFSRSIPQRIPCTASARGQAKKPPAWRQPVNRFRDGSPQETALRAAMNEFFHTKTLGFWNEGLGHWIVYWATPIWVGYGGLLILLIPALTFDRLQCSFHVKTLVLPAITWGLLSGLFLLEQMRFMSSADFGVSTRHLNRLPPQVQNHFEPMSRLPELFDKLSVRGVLGVTQTLLFAVYLFLINLLKL